MRFTPPARLAYRHCGGEVLSRGRPLSPRRAAETLAALVSLEGAACAQGDETARQRSAALACQLAEALEELARWRRAAGIAHKAPSPESSRPERVLRDAASPGSSG
jgi:hypothetical protein